MTVMQEGLGSARRSQVRGLAMGSVLHRANSTSHSASEWELVIVDNSSTPAVSTPTRPGLPTDSVVVEPPLSLTYARIRGIRESRGDVIVFVDDDNLLDPDFLETALDLAEAFPQIGAFGGRISGDFETPPPEGLLPFLPHLAVIDVSHDEWSNLAGTPGF